eukprot:TRINITY_DN5933_c0_g1_i2.p2 TRINITY_DN5933_c0_g1~~TRINITY_DN5933_c0_g1_i2.p2  ORF type:complete len:430 (+),score=103.39 TRINITY_DN5933_c0_g1_i2:1641-2930(+)
MGEEDDARAIFVTGVSDKVAEANLRELFSFAGKLSSVAKLWDVQRKEFGYRIAFEKQSAARIAAGLHGTELAGKVLAVEPAGKATTAAPPPAAGLSLSAPAPLPLPLPAQAPLPLPAPAAAPRAPLPGMPPLPPDPPPAGPPPPGAPSVHPSALVPVPSGLPGLVGLPSASAVPLGPGMPTLFMDEQQKKEAEERYQRTLEEIARTIHVAGFERGMSEKKLVSFFSPCGPVAHIRMGEASGTTYAFMEFLDVEAASKALVFSGVEITPGFVIRVGPSSNAIVKTRPQLEERKLDKLQMVLAKLRNKGVGKKAPGSPSAQPQRRRPSPGEASSESFHADRPARTRGAPPEAGGAGARSRSRNNDRDSAARDRRWRRDDARDRDRSRGGRDRSERARSSTGRDRRRRSRSRDRRRSRDDDRDRRRRSRSRG